ncbi:MAG TPA: substrate-binding domain-containing protein [Streptosporangiaceae bacterium]
MTPSSWGRCKVGSAIAALAISVVTLAACGSGGTASSSATSGPAATSAAPAAATDLSGLAASVSAAQQVPGKIAITGQLPKAPAKGIKVALLTCSAPACSGFAPAFKQATQALGWDLTVLTYNSATPGQAVQNALDAGNKYIAMVAIQLSTITPQVQEAKQKGVPLFIIAASPTDQPQNTGNGLYGVTQGAAFDQLVGKQIADYMIVTSQGHANIVDVVNPLFPTLAAIDQAEKAEITKTCASCAFASLPVSLSQIGAGQVPSLVVAYLKSHPDATYTSLTVGDFFPGLLAALQTAGLSKQTKIVGVNATAAEVDSLAQGQTAGWVVTSVDDLTWITADGMARLSLGQQISTANLAAGDRAEGYLITTPTQAKATQQLLANGYWPGPAGYQQQFEALWRVG